MVAALFEVGGSALNKTSLNGHVPTASLASDVVSVDMLGSDLSTGVGVTVSSRSCVLQPCAGAGRIHETLALETPHHIFVVASVRRVFRASFLLCTVPAA